MEFDINNIPLVIGGVLLLISAGLNILLSLSEGTLSKIAIIISVPAHAGMLVCLLLSGAPLGLAVASLLFSVLALSVSALVKYEVRKARERRKSNSGDKEGREINDL